MTPRKKSRLWMVFWLTAALATMATRCSGQSATVPKTNEEQAAPNEQDDSNQMSEQNAMPDAYKNEVGAALLKNLASDQRTIWTSPAHLRFSDLDWLLPLGTATGILLATDSDVSRHLSKSPNRLRHSQDVSNYGIASIAAVGGGLYVWGHITHEEHKRETGLLAGEAALDALAVDYALKYSFQRERPMQDSYRGDFWSGGDSLPSTHTATAWAMASVIAHEYPGTLPTVLAYGAATAISLSRVTGQQHFPSDVLVGSAIGWFVGQEVYRHHHDPRVGGRDWQTYSESTDQDIPTSERRSGSVGSPYVELDSWIYPAIERLVAMGYIRSQFLGIRPWTRLACAALVEEAGDAINGQSDAPGGATEIYDALRREFSGDLAGLGEGGPASAQLESIYTQVTEISGPPLNDSDHFGQTIVNNFGRPYEQGLNTYDGISGYASAGRFSVYVRGEYQHAPSAPGYSLPVREAIATADVNPLQPETPIPTTDQFRLLDTYFTTDYADWNFSFGKQSLWWGPENGGSLILSDNAEPMYMFRINPQTPFRIPLLSRVLGPAETDFFVGKFSGNDFPARPVIHGEKISFKPTANIEFGFSRIVEFAGEGRPLTAGAVWNSFVSVKSSVNYKASANPGKRTSGFEFSYRLPVRGNSITLYADSLGPDDVVTLESPSRAAWNTGVYIPRLPWLSRFDLRVEGGYTDPPTPRSNNGDFVYWDLHYHDLSLNKNNLIGSWMGREGKSVQALSTYWVTRRNNIQFGYREAKVAHDFIPGGETINDGSLKLNWWIKGAVNISAGVQYEKWVAPILAPGPQTNWTSSFALSFWPRAHRAGKGQPADARDIRSANGSHDGE